MHTKLTLAYLQLNYVHFKYQSIEFVVNSGLISNVILNQLGWKFKQSVDILINAILMSFFILSNLSLEFKIHYLFVFDHTFSKIYTYIVRMNILDFSNIPENYKLVERPLCWLNLGKKCWIFCKILVSSYNRY